MNKIVTISPEASLHVEQLMYEYEATKNILAFLMEQKSISQPEVLTAILERTQQRHIEFSMVKNTYVEQYCPEEFKDKNFDFNFNFTNNTIEYKEKMEEKS